MSDTVYVVDDDEAVRDSLSVMLGGAGFSVEDFESPEVFLAVHDHCTSGCLLLDICMPGMDGLEVQERLNARHSLLPVIIITGHADVPTAVKAMRNGAVDFVEKPFNQERLLETIRAALEYSGQNHGRAAERERALAGLARLSRREQEVLEFVAEGWTNEETGEALYISRKTVEAHRARIMRKMGVHSLAQLVRLVVLSEQMPG